MFLSRAQTSGIDAARRLQDSYHAHQVVWSLFKGSSSKESERDFLFRQDSRSSGVKFFILSQRRPDHSVDGWDVESKPFRPCLTVGDNLKFSIRVNPTVCRTNSLGKKIRHDVVMDLKRHNKDRALDHRSPDNLMHEAGLHWLSRRAQINGFQLHEESIRIHSYNRVQLAKARQPGRQVVFSTLDIDGYLQVTDCDLFQNVLTKGLGRSKSFGCGLMLVKRA